MPKSTTKRRAPKFRRLAAVEVEESIAARLEARAASLSRYRHGGDVAAQIVMLYLDQFEELEKEMDAFRQRQFRRERRRGFKVVK